MHRLFAPQCTQCEVILHKEYPLSCTYFASQRRVSVFTELYEANRMENISVDADQSDQLLKLLDSVVIKLEGGTDLDLQVLDQVPEEDVKPQINEEEKKPFILGEE